MRALRIEEIEILGEDGGRIVVSPDLWAAEPDNAGIVLRLAADDARAVVHLDDEETSQLRAMIAAQVPNRRFGGRGVSFAGDDGTKLNIHPSNMGEPFREGLRFSFDVEREVSVRVFVRDTEVLRLAAAIDWLTPHAAPQPRV